MRSILSSEWTKFYSFPLCMISAIGTILIAPIILIFMRNNMVDTSNVVTQSIRAFSPGQAGIVVMAAGFFGQEYEQSCIRTTFLSTPSRIRVIAAKAVILMGVCIAAIMVSGLFCVVVSVMQYGNVITWQWVSKFAIQILIAAVSWVQIAFISAGMTMITKTQIIPIAAIVPLILGLSQLLFAILKLARFLPDLATMNLFLNPDSSIFLGKWTGIFVQFVWVLSLGIPAVWRTMCRDVR